MADNKTQKTAGGQEIDMQSLILRNEDTRAVGNMKVNARGDVIDDNNKPTSSRSAQVFKSYRKQIGNVAADVPVFNGKVQEAEEQLVGLDEVEEVIEEPKITKAKKSKTPKS